MLIGSVSGGMLGSVDLSVPYVVRSGLLVAAFFIGYRAMHDTGFTVRAVRWGEVPHEMARVGRESLKFGWREPHARMAILASAMPYLVIAWAYYAWQPYFLQLLGMSDVRVLGVVAAAVSLAMASGSWLVERLTRFCGRRTTLLLGASIVFVVTTIGVGLTDSFWIAVTLYLVSNVASSAFTPVSQAYLHAVIPSEQRATVLSLSNLVASAGSMGGQAGLGWLAASRSLGVGYVAGGLAAAFTIPWVLAMRRLGGAPDRIKGTAARFAACESLAIPAGGAVESREPV
jgi:MFS family permease